MKKLLFILIALALIAGIYLAQKRSFTPGDDQLVVGAILPITGPIATFGEHFRAGLDYALAGEEYVRLIIEDSKGNPVEGIAAFDKLVNLDKVDVVIAIMGRVAYPLVNKAKEAELPLIISLMAVNEATSVDNPYVHRMFFTADQMGEAIYQSMKAENFSNVGILQLEEEATKSMTDYLKSHLEESGVSVHLETFPGTVMDFRTLVSKFKAKQVDALAYALLAPTQYINLMEQLKESNLNVPIYDVTSAIVNPGTRESLGDLAEGIRFATWPLELDLHGQGIANKYEAEKDQTFSGYVAFGYDIGRLLSQMANDGALDKNKVLKELDKLESFDGSASELHFVEPNNILPDLIPVVIEDGEIIKK